MIIIDFLSKVDSLMRDFLILALYMGAIYIVGCTTIYIADYLLDKLDESSENDKD